MSLDDFKHSFPTRTVCEVTREINDLIQRNRERLGNDLFGEIYIRLQEQMRMQKKMDAKLRQYEADWDAGLFKANPDYLEIEKKRMESHCKKS